MLELYPGPIIFVFALNSASYNGEYVRIINVRNVFQNENGEGGNVSSSGVRGKERKKETSRNRRRNISIYQRDPQRPSYYLESR